MDLVFEPVAPRGGSRPADDGDKIATSLAEAARHHAMGNGRAALRHSAAALSAIAEKYDLHGYAVI